MALPGKAHFKAAKHLLNFFRCHHRQLGLTFYADVKDSSIYESIKENSDVNPESPLILFTDSSWQDCPDTGRSTGGYLLYHQGGIIDGASFTPNPVAMSTAEAKYNALAYAMQAVINSKQSIQELHGNHPDTPLSVPLLCDSESAIIMGSNQKDTKRTRHIQRRMHFVRDNFASKAFTSHKIPGELNPSDTGTKGMPSDKIKTFIPLMHSTVPL